MAISDVADEYFAHETRLASFQVAQQLSKRRGSNLGTKAPKSMKWPHKWMSGEQLAKAGFFYYPSQGSPDNVACFLCRKNIDGWEKGDDPLVEHLKHSPDCGWGIIAMIERQDEGEFSEEYPLSCRLVEARKATFADKWPHENKKGWKCKIKKLIDAGWKYTPTPESDDNTTCMYCELALDGWENEDKPLDEHLKRSPDCAFFTLINTHKQQTKTKRGRASKVSRLSTQSAFTTASDKASIADLPAEEGDSILTTATNATTTTQGGRKMVKTKKAAAKGRKTKAKKEEAVEVGPAPEAEDDDFEVKVEEFPKTSRGRKRKSEESIDLDVSVIEPPPEKRRAPRTRASTVINDNTSIADESMLSVAGEEAPKPVGRKRGRASTARFTRKTSTAPAVTLSAAVPNDDEIDAALEADLKGRWTDDEAPMPPPKKGGRASKFKKADHAMFGTSQMEVDDAAIELELQAIEVDSKPLPKAKVAKGKQPRKASAKQQAAARKAAESEAVSQAEAEAERLAEEEEEAAQQIAADLEHSLSIHHSSPIVQPKRQRASSRQPSRQASRQPLARSTGASVLAVDDSNVEMTDDFQDALDEQQNDSGNETDASMASQSTVVRGGSTRRVSTLKKGRGGKTAAISRNIEEIVHTSKSIAVEEPIEDTLMPTVEAIEPSRQKDTTTQDEDFFTPAPEVPESPQSPLLEEPAPKPTKAKPAPKARGRPAKAAQALVIDESVHESEPLSEPVQPKSKVTKRKGVARLPSPTPPKEITPIVESPQSSDAENQPPSYKAPPSMRKPTTPHANTIRIPLATTPMLSPSKRNIIAGLQSTHPWTAVDLDAVFLGTPGDESGPSLFGDMMIGKMKGGNLPSPERKMTVEEWIHYNAEMAEEKLRGECERMVGAFEREGGRAMRALEAVKCAE